MSNNRNNHIILGVLCALGCETIFGLSYLFAKQATDLASPFALLGWRYMIAAAFMTICALTGIIKINLKGKKIKPLILVALFNPSIYFIGETVGISRTTASESGVFLACIPVASLIASTLILRQKPTKFQIVGILITLIGVSVTVLAAGMSSSFSLIGYLFLLLGVCSYALYAVFVDKAADYTGAEITYLMTLAGALVFGILSMAESFMNGSTVQLISLPFSHPQFLIAILYLGIVSTFFGFLLSNLAIARLGVNRTSSFIGFGTVVSIVAGVIGLHESFTLFQIIGAAIILAGVYTANIRSSGK